MATILTGVSDSILICVIASKICTTATKNESEMGPGKGQLGDTDVQKTLGKAKAFLVPT